MLALLVACDGSGFDAASASELAEPHLEAFAEYERWARRVLVADPAIRSRAALEERLFAPIRRDDAVQGIWIERESDERAIVFGHVAEYPGQAARTVTDPSLGPIEISAAKLPDPRGSGADGAPRRSTIIIRRTIRDDEGATTSVAVAYLTP